YPSLNVAFDISEPQPLAWAFPLSDDNTLYDAAEAFFEGLTVSGELDRLLERYYGHISKFDYAGTHIYLRHVNRRLPAYRELFERAASDNNLDWRLLAAVAYQESHWNRHAVSPTGVRGIMMLTQATAAHVGIQKRTDPEQSITGGAHYLRKLLDKVPAHIPEPDRTFFALAAYNVGYGHLEDAREITKQRGGDADKWTDVKENLPLLRLRKWYSKTRHGYARGNEPVRYVENIRSYYDILSWHLDRRFPPEPPNPVLSISPPVL
ncbi:MAG: membrane-bound lytic murein transglycosylase MltF, partial [Pseudomonadota bacterium]